MPHPDDFEEASDRVAAQKALDYMALVAGTPMREVTQRCTPLQAPIHAHKCRRRRVA